MYRRKVLLKKVIMDTQHLGLQRGFEGGGDGRIASLGFRTAGAGTSTFTA
jgi:hypothetical protein